MNTSDNLTLFPGPYGGCNLSVTFIYFKELFTFQLMYTFENFGVHLQKCSSISVYFQQTIAFSGSIFCEFAISDTVVADNIELIKTVGCDSENTAAMRDCMKKLDVDRIMDGVEKIVSSY